MNITLIIGALLGLSSVALGAYLDHASLPAKEQSSALTALRYHQFYALVICVISLALPLYANLRAILWLKCAAWIFIVGAVLFSFSIYASSLLNLRALVYGAPFGGILIMLGWLNLLIAACLIRP